MTRELAASRQEANDAQSGYLNQIAAMAEEIEETRRDSRSRKDLFINWQRRTGSLRVRTPRKASLERTPMIVDELY